MRKKLVFALVVLVILAGALAPVVRHISPSLAAERPVGVQVAGGFLTDSGTLTPVKPGGATPCVGWNTEYEEDAVIQEISASYLAGSASLFTSASKAVRCFQCQLELGQKTPACLGKNRRGGFFWNYPGWEKVGKTDRHLSSEKIEWEFNLEARKK